jgi:hypothetical protein
MDRHENVPYEEIIRMKNKIEKYILKNDYENALDLFLFYMLKLNSVDRDIIIEQFSAYFKKKCSQNKTVN